MPASLLDLTKRLRRSAAVWLALAAAFALAAAGSADFAERDASAAPQIRIGANGLDLSAHAGKVVILNIWATWCAPCRRELPSLQRLADDLNPARAVVIGLALDTDSDFVREYLRDARIRFANVIAPHPGFGRDALDVRAVPQTLVFDAHGDLRGRIVGARSWDTAKARAELAALEPALGR